MEKRWNVYRDDQPIGLMTAAEIRDALRRGEVDPFDIVSQEGGGARLELLDVDEIFLATGTPDPEANVETIRVPMLDVAGAGPPPREDAAPQDDRTARRRSRKPRRANKRMAKQFYLIDRRARILGPLHPSEIQSLYYRGILNQGVKVQKAGENRRVPINTFISVYSGQRVAELSRSGAAKKIRGNAVFQPSAAVLNELHRGINTKVLAGGGYWPLIGLFVLGIILGVVVFVATSPVEDEPPAKKSSWSPEKKQRKKSSSAAQRRKLKKWKKKVKPAAGSVKKAPKKLKVRKKPKLRNKPKLRKKPKVTRQPRRQPAPPVVRSRGRPLPERRSSRVTPVQRTRPAPARSPPVATRRPVVPGGGHPLSGRNGMIGTAGGSRYSVSALSRCGLKCRLHLSLPGGHSATAVFFKGAFEEQFRARGGRATVVGNVKESGGRYLIFVKGVR